MYRFIFPVLVLISLLGCGKSEEAKEPNPAEASVCYQVDSLVNAIESFKSSLENENNTSAREANLRNIIGLMNRNAVVEGDCNYLNTELHPDHLRFDFVENLRNWTIRDTFYQGIYYLLKLRGAYSDDSAIYEFFSEEIARVAFDNPSCYDGYLRQQPSQLNMVLSTTHWSYPDLPQLKSKFTAINALPAITDFLDQLKPTLP